ncbi:MAG TPA: ABC transporter substrate-binding protein [Oscillospiraceae bacterium]|nr:ABC transporter substrate-binding protein [Oscillospiraceae bacterium]
MAISAKKLTAAVCALSLLAGVCGCGRTVLTGDGSQAQPRTSDSAQSVSSASDGKFSLFYDSGESMNPMKTQDVNNQLVCSLAYENMVEVDGSFKVSPKVLSEWSTDDGINWVLKVAEGHTFSDGSAVSAADVAYSLRLAINGARFENRFDGWLSAISTQDGEVLVELTRANYLFPTLLTVPVVKSGTEGEYPVGSGPYAWADDHLSLTASAAYPNAAKLPVNAVYLQTYSSVDDFVSKFEDSTVDLVLNDPSASSNVGFASSNEIRAFNTTNLQYVCVNLESDEFKSGDLQFALNYAFDRNYMVNSLLGGDAVAVTTPISPASALHNTSYDSRFAYSLEKCAAALDNFGIRDYDSDGLREYKSGGAVKKIAIRFAVCSENGAKVSMVQKFADDMKTLGITVTVTKYDWDDYKQALTAGSFDLAYCEVRLAADFDPSPMLSSGGAAFFSRTDDPDIQGYINAYLAAPDDTRQKACDDLCEYIVNTATIIPICFEKHQIITHRGALSNMTVDQNDPLCDFANWTITTK